jgi:hypothetical protein
MALSLSDLTAFTEQYIVERTTDVIFKESPLLARMLGRRRMRFAGGTYIQRPLMYAQLNGDWFGKGDVMNIAYVTTDTAVTVNMKTVYVNVSLYFIDNILNRGPQAAFSIVESKFANASMTMAKLIATALYQDGQSSVAPPFTTALSGTKSLDGLLAWIDDGNNSGSYTTNTDSTKSFTSVGGQTRSDFFTTAPSFTGATTPSTAIQGLNAYTNRSFTPFTLNDVNTAYGNAWFGRDFPDLITTTQTGYNRMWNAIQPLQRYNMEGSGTDVGKIGFNAFQFNASTVVVDKYIPSDGTNGVMFGLNTNYLELYSSDAKSAQFGFTGFKEAQQSLDVAGQFVWAGNLIGANPRTSFKLVGPVLL